MLDELFAITKNLNHRFPDGNQPFQIMTRMLEECGELAQQVNHFESTGVKQQKYGVPDKTKMAKEVMDVIRGALQIALYYGLEAEVEAFFETAYRSLPPEHRA
ncbi:MAG: hypothetical protein L0332_16555 [Chloroflexi bacterium]|nr:hypothetical protein [Chloroflexota bacterium]MCI0579115.1 hypothetical protein [Chloroflexota bacterium]MCI0643332.1 hypothetical protein [Chloroflexota bacterium]MCI0728311.1 hypothetical protein [Chloroflexota bacterium]